MSFQLNEASPLAQCLHQRLREPAGPRLLYGANTSRSHIPSLEGRSEDYPSYPCLLQDLAHSMSQRPREGLYFKIYLGEKTEGHYDLQKIKATLMPLILW